MKNMGKKRALALSACAFAITAVAAKTQPNNEQDSAPQSALEVIQVTAQKRSADAQKTPISINVLGADDLKEKGIEKIDDLQYSVPNLHMTESGISTQIYIRGIGTGNNQGFEQSVGQYIDGIYYGRQQLLRMPFLDLERVEVLKGPQSILFGKNSVAGALNLSSAKPTQDFTAHFDASYQPEFGATEINGMVSGGLTEILSARFAVRDYQEEGYIDNTTKQRDETERDEQAYRLSLLWEPTDDLNVLLKVEHDEFNGEGRQIEIVQDDPNLETGLRYAQYLGLFGYPDGVADSELNYVRQADDDEFSHNEVDNVTLTANYMLNDYTLTSITSLVSYEFTEECDCDYVAAPVFNVDINESYDQFSQEFRIVSPLSETFDWIGGFYFQQSETDFDDRIKVPLNSILPLANTALAPIADTSAGRNYTLDSTMWSAFFQGNYHINDDLTLTVGARYTDEKKDAHREINIRELAGSTIGGGDIVADPMAAILYNVGFAIQNEQSTLSPQGHNLTDSRDETAFTPLVSVQYKLDEDVMTYASATTGFKAGGFDARANNIDSWEFEEEEATSFEWGIKSALLENTLEVNLAVYRTNYDNLQISQFDGTLGFNVGNAKETVVQGMEIDGRWLVMDTDAGTLTMNYAVAYLDHEFKDFKNGNCYNRQEPDGDIGPGGVQLCDFTGKSGQYTPKFTGNLGFDYFRSISFWGFEYFRANLGFYHTSKQNVHPNLDPLYTIDGYTKVDARIALEAESWSIALFGKNLTDEKVLTYAGNAPLSGSSFGTNTFYGFVDRPVTIGIQFQYDFAE
ncbi:MAG: TonB-dependent receptor [Litorilituus sp.]|jgi:outer membrane receptor protein involved in Fe transport|nr:TonB-dependent receptor [Litorilituus sp.]